MTKDKTDFIIIGPHTYWAETVLDFSGSEVNPRTVTVDNGAFSHVLSVPASEEVWPEDAVELFFPELFGVRLNGVEEYAYLRYGPVHIHMRDEILRLASNGHGYVSLETTWRAELKAYCYERNPETHINGTASFAGMFGSDDSVDAPRSNLIQEHVDYYDQFYSERDSGTDDDEEDTLNSELLLTEEYTPPEKG